MPAPRATELIVRSLVRSLGLSLEEVLAATNTTVGADGTFDYAQGMQLWDTVERLSNDPSVGHRAGAELRLNDLGVIGTAFAHAPDLRTGLSTLGQLVPVAIVHTELTVADRTGAVEIHYRRPEVEGTGSRHGVESLFAALLSLARQSTRRWFPVASIALETEPPASPSIYEAFYGAPVTWRVARSALRIRASDAAMPMVGADPQLAALLLEHAPRLLAPRASGPDALQQRVARAFWSAREEGDGSIAATARRCGMSARSLQRRLTDAGWSFTDLRDHLLEERATTLLGDTSLSVEQVADLLGYASRAAFERAFTRWTGRTPAAHRRATR
ncbi:MAG: AraC family transcriptional regulator ligand-binding domain-containing protein [Myxococcales bacterium]|nr:AraC family transcriptional regulator ligand-binding domain-containing protein [Myxococcales bacterium]